MNFKNFSRSAAWPLTDLDDSTYRLLDSDSLSPWTSLAGFDLLTVSYDWLHNVYLGIGRDICASAVLTLIEKNVYTGSDRSDLEVVLGDVHRDIRETCSRHGLLNC